MKLVVSFLLLSVVLTQVLFCDGGGWGRGRGGWGGGGFGGGGVLIPLGGGFGGVNNQQQAFFQLVNLFRANPQLLQAVLQALGGKCSPL